MIRKLTPRAPAYLDKTAAAMWKEKAKSLAERDDLTAADWSTLEMFCNAYSQYRAAVNDLNIRGFSVFNANGGEARNPALTARDMAEKTMLKCGDLLGFNPVSRRKTPVKKAAGDDLDF